MNDQSNIEITDADPKDAAVLWEFLEPFSKEGQILRRSVDEVRHLTTHGFCAWNGTQCVGFAGVEIYSRKLAEVLCLAVDSSVRSQGIGRKLVDCCLERAKELGVMEVMAISSSDDFLRSCGFDYTLPDQKKALFYQLRKRE